MLGMIATKLYTKLCIIRAPTCGFDFDSSILFDALLLYSVLPVN